jgi:dTDP-4-dehydrorhamnose 3,5-epimerase
MAISGSWLFSPVSLADSRGLFLEAFSARTFREATGTSLELAQVNLSVSKMGVIRGIHFTGRTPGQAKYVMCVQGQIRDVVVDLRPDSITFGHWDSAVLDDLERRAVFIEAGLGHAFQVLCDSATVVYITSTPYDPDNEFSISPLDPELDLPWDLSLPQLLSARDSVAPSFRDFFGDSRSRT